MIKVENNLELIAQTHLDKQMNEFHIKKINNKDLNVIKELFVKIAVEAATQSSENFSLLPQKIEIEVENQNLAEQKVEQFINNNFFRFEYVCNTGLAFSLLKRSACEMVLRKELNSNGSVILHLMMTSNVIADEEYLQDAFKKIFSHLTTHEVALACSGLQDIYQERGDHRAGYYLLWLIKQSAGIEFCIPPLISFDKSTVEKVLLNLFTQKILKIASPINLIEIFLNRYLFSDLLSSESIPQFLDFIIEPLQNIAMHQWPEKAFFIIQFFMPITPKNRLFLASALEKSTDGKTAEIGSHLLNALQSNSIEFKDQIPHFRALAKLLYPYFDYNITERLFARPFPCFKRSWPNDPAFTQRLEFNGLRKVFVQGDLMIGGFRTITRQGLPSYLLGYNMKTEELMWGIPLTSSIPEAIKNIEEYERYHLHRVAENIALQFNGDDRTFFIELDTGKICSILKMPYVFKGVTASSHFPSREFGYQLVSEEGSRWLVGGKIISGEWATAFKIKTPIGAFMPLSTHIGFRSPLERGYYSWTLRKSDSDKKLSEYSGNRK